MYHVSLRVWSPRAVARIALMILVLVASSLSLVAASAPSAPTTAKLKVAQLVLPPMLVAPGERLEVEYDTRTLPSATGFLYVRNDLQRVFTRVTLRLSKSSVFPTDKRRLLRGAVRARTVRGHWLYYYAVIHDRKSGRSVRVPAGLESVRVLTGAQIVKLGTHRFGQLRAPEAIVASAGPKDVAIGNDEMGYPFGPWSFLVAPDRSVWLVDRANWRLLAWPPGQPNAHPRAVSLPWAPADLALGPGGSLYVSHKRPGKYHIGLSRLSVTGRLLWTSELATTIVNINLRLGPDGTLYWTGGLADPRGDSWVPAAMPAGRPLSTAYQLRRRLYYQPLPGGLRLVSSIGRFEMEACGSMPHEMRYALINRAGRLLRSWRITSGTSIMESLSATPALVGRDPVVVLLVTRCGSDYQQEYLVVRLARSGPSRTRFSLPAASDAGKDQSGRAGWGTMVTDVRIGPGAKLYQLGSSPTVGVRIMHFSLGAGK